VAGVEPSAASVARPPGRLRWWIGAILFLSTVVNYIDRQTLSVLGPTLKTEYSWSNSDFALIIIAFRVAYTIGQGGAGRLLDRVGTRLGLTVTVAFYSTAAMLTSLASGLRSFCFFRFLLGAGESGNWPGATKAVSEWFPRRESGWAVALFDSGSSIGAAVAPVMVVGLLHVFGTWRPVFLITGTLGFLWLLPLFHAEPKLGPVYRQVTHFIPWEFPLLIIVPAIAVDLMLQRTGHWRPLLRGTASGLVFFATFLAVQWPFANFLMSPLARNRFFGTAYMDFSTPSASLYARFEFVPPQTVQALGRGMLIAVIASCVMTYVGLHVGRAMQRVNR